MQTSDASRVVQTRRMDFEAAVANTPRHFAGDNEIVMSHVWAILSAVFPDGEDFFVRSVRHYRSEITDPVLKKQVAGFIGQEAMHGREHRALNDRLDEVGYPAKRIERVARRVITFRERLAPPIANLALTVALEHVTALLAEMILTEPDVRDLLGDSAVQDMYLWHALEESEHRAVAFDVYRAVGGPEWLRRYTMRAIRYGLLPVLAIGAPVIMAIDRQTYRNGNLRKSLRALRHNPFLRRSVWRRLADFERRDFHPDDHDNALYLDAWKDTLFGDAGTLNDKLVGAA